MATITEFKTLGDALRCALRGGDVAAAFADGVQVDAMNGSVNLLWEGGRTTFSLDKTPLSGLSGRRNDEVIAAANRARDSVKNAGENGYGARSRARKKGEEVPDLLAPAPASSTEAVLASFEDEESLLAAWKAARKARADALAAAAQKADARIAELEAMLEAEREKAARLQAAQ